MSEQVDSGKGRRVEGVVVSDKSDKTVVVNVTRRFQHKTYKKFISKSKKYHAHDEENKAKVGDRVVLVESRPYSKTKTWRVISIA